MCEIFEYTTVDGKLHQFGIKLTTAGQVGIDDIILVNGTGQEIPSLCIGPSEFICRFNGHINGQIVPFHLEPDQPVKQLTEPE